MKNPEKLHPVTGKPVAFAVVPGAHTARPMAGPDSAVLWRAPFVSRNLWVTPHDQRQRYPAGEYVMQARRCSGLSRWTERDEPLLARSRFACSPRFSLLGEVLAAARHLPWKRAVVSVAGAGPCCVVLLGGDSPRAERGLAGASLFLFDALCHALERTQCVVAAGERCY